MPKDAVGQGTEIITLAVLLGIGYGIVLFVLSIFETAVGPTTDAGLAIGNFIAAYTSPTVFTIVGAVILLMFLSLAAPAIHNLIGAFTNLGGGKKGKGYE